MKSRLKRRAGVMLALCMTVALPGLDVLAQPSGGPYGPLPQKYELPKVEGRTWFVAPNGNPEAAGSHLTAPTTIEAAFEKVKSGDAIVLRGGTYRSGNLLLNQGITMQPFGDEQVELKGTLEAREWTDLGRGLWMTEWETLFPMAPEDWWVFHNAGRQTPLHRFHNDMVFADGRFLQSAGWLGEVDADHFFVDYDKKLIYVGLDPEKHLMEITAFDVAIHRVDGPLNGLESDQKGPSIKGITFTQYAYRAFEFDGTNPERVFILSSSNVLLEHNIFTRNNIENISGYFPAAVKIFNQCYDVVCNDNLVTDLENSNGIWYDVGNVDERYDHVLTNNLFVATPEYLRPFINVWQTPELCETLSDNPVKSMDGNVFVTNPAYSEDLIYWSPLPAEENCRQSFRNLAAFAQAHPVMNQKSADYPLGSIPLFKGLHTANYELLPTFPGHERAVALPSRVQKLLQTNKNQQPYIGAHPAE